MSKSGGAAGRNRAAIPPRAAAEEGGSDFQLEPCELRALEGWQLSDHGSLATMLLHSLQYEILEVVGKRSYGIVGVALDTKTRENVAIKKIHDVFEHVSDATRILREIMRLRLLQHPDVVEIKHIMLPPSRREFRDIYVVFELMKSDLHQVIKANDVLTPEHHQFFLYQLLRSLKYIHSGLDNLELLTEIGASGSSAFSFGVDEVISEDEDLDNLELLTEIGASGSSTLVD
ncbi:Mitogen-activated protein kinase 15 [Platanthera guangdongensis]|uniref:Mitogen-activated protein kinase 15 n=1 Tax=Platanthera guangdongensis TaxID=2320717 RepID=A0ABR2MW38_9ASPA